LAPHHGVYDKSIFATFFNADNRYLATCPHDAPLFIGKVFNPCVNLTLVELLRWSQQMVTIIDDKNGEKDDRTHPFFLEDVRQIAIEVIYPITSLFPQVFTWGKLN
jgi:hypothetical protein